MQYEVTVNGKHDSTCDTIAQAFNRAQEITRGHRKEKMLVIVTPVRAIAASAGANPKTER